MTPAVIPDQTASPAIPRMTFYATGPTNRERDFDEAVAGRSAAGFGLAAIFADTQKINTKTSESRTNPINLEERCTLCTDVPYWSMCPHDRTIMIGADVDGEETVTGVVNGAGIISAVAESGGSS